MRSPVLDLRPRSVRTRGSSGFATAPPLNFAHPHALSHRFLYMVPFRRRPALNPLLTPSLSVLFAIPESYIVQ